MTSIFAKINSNIKLKKVFTILLCLLLSVMLIIPAAACSSSSSSSNNKDSIDVCEASEPLSLDPGLNSAVDGSVIITHILSGLAKWKMGPDGEPTVQAEFAKSLPEPTKNPDGTFTYTYNLIENAKWSDGVPVTAKDYVYGWNRSASVELASDFSYMFEIVKGYDDIWAKEPVEGAKLDVVALDDYTLQVTTTADVPYWNEFLAFPVFLPMREDVCDNEGMWATDPATYICNGPYNMVQWNHNSVIRLSQSDSYPFKDEITMTNINFYLSDNANNQLANFATGDWKFIKDMPTNEIASLKTDYADSYNCDPQTGTYYISFSQNFDLSPVGGRHLSEDEQAEVRGAITLLLDRNYIVDNVLQGGQIPASSFVPPGIKQSDGSQFYQNSGKAGDPYYGYFSTDKDNIESNYKQAQEILYKYYNKDENGFVTDFPQMTYIYNTNEAHKAIAEYFQNVLSGIGIKLNLENQEWATFLATKKSGAFTLCRNSWIADYNDAICFLDCNISTSGNNASSFGKGAVGSTATYDMDLSGIAGYESKSVTGGTWQQTYDQLVSWAKTEENLTVRDQLMHKAEDLLFETNCICPVYFYTHNYLLASNVKGFYSTSLGVDNFMYTYYE